MTISEVKQWIVSADKLARPVNPFNYDSSVEYTAYERFAPFAQQHIFATDLEPGIYDGDKVEVICKHLSGIEWPYENTGREIKKSIAINVELCLKQQPKTLENDIIHESAKKFANDKSIPITGTFYEVFMGGYKSALRLPIQPLNPNAIKVIQKEVERLAELRETHLNGEQWDKLTDQLKILKRIIKLLKS